MKFLLSFFMFASASVMADDAYVCAVAYNSLSPEYTSQLVLRSGDRIRNLNQIQLERSEGDWDNKISAVSINQGCTLVAYQYQNFNTEYHTQRPLDGFTRVYENPIHRGFNYVAVDHEANEKISSLKCYCPTH